LFEKLRKLAREPLVHFLLIGVGIYAAYGLFAAGEDESDERRITVKATDVQALGDQWTRLWGRPPTQEELAGVIRDHVRTQILYREAVAMGLDRGDLVIERRLAQKVELLAQGLITPEDPGEEELRAWYDTHLDDYTQPKLYTVTHVFFDPDKRDATTLDDAEAALEKLSSLDAVPENFASYGDRFMLQNYYPSRTELELRKLFGGGFVEQIVELELDEWHGPILSGYGTHLVRVTEIVEAPAPLFEAVEARVREEWLKAQIDEMSERFVDNLIARYEIDVEEVSVPITVPGTGAGQ